MPKSVLKQNGKRCIGQSNDNAQTAKRLKSTGTTDNARTAKRLKSTATKDNARTAKRLKSTASRNGKEYATPSKRHAEKTKRPKGHQVRRNVVKNKYLVKPKQNDVLKNNHTSPGKTETPGELFWLLLQFMFDFFVKY